MAGERMSAAAPVPAGMRRVRWILALMVCVHLVDIVLFVGHRGELRHSVVEVSPNLGTAQVTASVDRLTLLGVIPHLVFAAAFAVVWLALPGGRPWARRAAITVLAADIVAGVFAVSVMRWLPSVAVAIAAVVAVSVVLQIAALAWLWRSAASRRFFGGPPSPPRPSPVRTG